MKTNLKTKECLQNHKIMLRSQQRFKDTVKSVVCNPDMSRSFYFIKY